MTGELFGETTRTVDPKPNEVLEGEAVMEGVEHIGQYVFDMQSAKVEDMRRNGGQLPTRDVNMRDAVEMVEDGEEDVVVPEDDEEEEDTKPNVQNSGRHIEVEATSSVKTE
jgi:intron-binding protein aquarius